jgi:hypothetical protein
MSIDNLSKSVCFVTEANQENYVNQFNNKIENLPEDFDFTYYVSSNLPNRITKKYNNLKIFNLEELQDRDMRTKQYEVITDNMPFFHYPNNIRRHIINKAFEDGFEYIVWNDCDVEFITTKNFFLEELKTFKINTIYTQHCIYRYGTSTNQRPFEGCDVVLKYFDSENKKPQLKIHDGPTAIYFFDKRTQKKYIEKWDDIVLYGYENPYSHQRSNERAPAEVYAVAFSDIDISHINERCFHARHDFGIRY